MVFAMSLLLIPAIAAEATAGPEITLSHMGDTATFTVRESRKRAGGPAKLAKRTARPRPQPSFYRPPPPRCGQWRLETALANGWIDAEPTTSTLVTTLVGDGTRSQVKAKIWCMYTPEGEPADAANAAGLSNAVVRQYLRQVRMPAPQPHIAPGKALTGLPAYLELGGLPTTMDFRTDTPHGVLSGRAIATAVHVDWGEGTGADVDTEWVSADPTQAGPYPHGAITHVYTTTGKRQVHVVAEWRADWSLANRSGTVDGLVSQGTITDFPVQQLQAVIVDNG